MGIICPIESEDNKSTADIRELLYSLLSMSDDELTGVILRSARSQYYTDGTAGLDMNNSDIIGLNALYFRDSSENADEGINFMRDDDLYDTLRVHDGKILFAAGRGLNDENTENFKVINDDTGWQNVTFTSQFTNYSTDRKVQYRRINGVVYFRGMAKVTANMDAVDVAYDMFTLPEDFRPEILTRFRLQGSGANSFCLTINPNGVVDFSRYGAGEYKAVTTSNLLCMDCSFVARG